MNDLVSVIIPVYNVEKYLVECVTSVLNQTYKNFEVILVDDGSTDKSGVICDKLAEANSKVIVVHKKNGGLSDARNVGITKANGTYISFIDSDDVVWEKYIEVLLEAVINNNADIAQGNYIENKNMLGDISGNTRLFLGKDGFKEFLLFGEILVSACAKIYKKSLFENIKFPEGRINEDNLTIYKLLYCSNIVVTVPYNVYYYRVNQGTIMHGKYNSKRFEVISVGDEIKSYLEDDYSNYIDEVEYHQIRVLYWVLNECFLHTCEKEYKAEKKELKGKILAMGTSNRYLSMKYKIYYSMLKYIPRLYVMMLRIYRRKEIGR